MRAWIKLVALLAAASVALTACSGGDGAAPEDALSLPSPPLSLERQILGDTSASITGDVTLYRASDSTLELTTVTRAIRADASGSILLPALEELLGSAPGGAQVIEDVEFGSGVATVRLSIDAAMNRGEQDYLLLCASIADTLLGIDGVEAVNVLSGNRSNSVCALPLGTFVEPNLNIPAAYAQMQSERDRFLTEGASNLERAACLYFPAYGGQYLLSEVRTLSFSGEDYASALIAALAEGPRARACCFSAIPANIELLEGVPRLSVTADGERVLDLMLSPVLMNYLALAGVEPWQLYGSLVLTLTTFVPELDAVRVSLNGAYVTECDMGIRMASFPDGRMRRADFSSFVGGSAQLYFVGEDGSLVRLECAVSQAGATSAASILSAMLTLGGSYRSDLRSAFPAGIVPEDILGVAIENHTAVVNLSGNFYAHCQSLDALGERTLIYAMVNALAELEPIGAVSFLVEGRQVDTLVKDIYLRTSLMPDPGLVRNSAPVQDAAEN